MQTYEIKVTDRTLTAEGDTTLVRTSIGVDRIRFTFDSDEWLGFTLACAFSIGGEVAEVALPVSTSSGAITGQCDVPDWVLEHEGPLGLCVHGADESDNHIITAAAEPLTVMREGDGIAASPSPNPM